MTLQAIAWGTTITLIREPSRVTMEHSTKPGNYVLAATDQASVDAAVAEAISDATAQATEADSGAGEADASAPADASQAAPDALSDRPR